MIFKNFYVGHYLRYCYNIIVKYEQMYKMFKNMKNKINFIHRITVEPNLEKSTNNGTIFIEIARDENLPLKPIVLDVFNVNISNVGVIQMNGLNSLNNDEIDLEFDSDYNEDNTTFVITLANKLEDIKNLRVLVSMDFVSEITDTLQGIYKTSYINLETNQKE